MCSLLASGMTNSKGGDGAPEEEGEIVTKQNLFEFNHC